jgi:hypothetical protein
MIHSFRPLAYYSAPKRRAAHSSEIQVHIYQTTRRHAPNQDALHRPRSETFNFHGICYFGLIPFSVMSDKLLRLLDTEVLRVVMSCNCRQTTRLRRDLEKDKTGSFETSVPFIKLHGPTVFHMQTDVSSYIRSP